MNTNQKCNRILAFLVANPTRNNVNYNTIEQTIFESSISSQEARELLNKVAASGTVKVLSGRYLGASIETKEFLSKGGFEGEKNFLFDLLDLLLRSHKETRLNEIIESFLAIDFDDRVRIVNILRDLESKKWIKISREYGQLNFRNKPIDYDIWCSLTTEGYKEATKLFLNNRALKVSKHANADIDTPGSNSEPDFPKSQVNRTSIFLSHNWAQKVLAEKIYLDLSAVGLHIVMDNHELSYKDSISSFMQSIRDRDYALMLISEEFLRSKNCMIEVLHISREKKAFDRILPVIVGGVKFYSSADRLLYLRYWNNKVSELKKAMNGLDPTAIIETTKELKSLNEIAQGIDEFLVKIGDGNNIGFDDLSAGGYNRLLQFIGHENYDFAFELLQISTLTNLEEKEIALVDYAQKHPLNALYFSLLAGVAKESGRLSLAKKHYQKSIELDSSSFTAYNNLGMVLLALQEFDGAKENFKNAIALDPQLSIARINLALLLSDHYRDVKEAKHEYEVILGYNPTNVKAHNNLGNIYRDGEFASEERAIFHFEQAIRFDPQHVDAYINLGNIYMNCGRPEEAVKLLQTALAVPNLRDNLRKVIEKLLEHINSQTA